MHGRRSIIKRRDDDDITMTRPLNKRVSFSVNNCTRLFQVDSDESTRQTNLDSTGQQSTMSLMEHTMSQTLTVGENNRSPLGGVMEITQINDLGDDEEEAYFDWTSKNMEVDPNIDAEQMQSEESKESNGKQSASNRPSIDTDDKTRPVELRKERTDTVKNEILKVASKLLKPGRSSDETRSSLDIYGIQAALNSQTDQSSAIPSETNATENDIDEPMCEESENIGDEETNMLEEDASLDEPRNASCQETTRGQSESWFEVTGVNNLEEGESSMKYSDLLPSPGSCLNQSSSSRDLSHRSEAETIDEEVEFEESRVSNRLANSRDSMARPRVKNVAEESSLFENVDSSSAETVFAPPKAKSSKSRRSTMVDFRNESSNSIEESDCATPKSSVLKKQLSPCLEESSGLDSILPERRTFDVSPGNSGSAPATRRTFDVLPDDSSSLHPERRTFDVLPADSNPINSTRRTFNVSETNETFSVHHNTQTKDTTGTDVSTLADEPMPSFHHNVTLPLLHRSTRSFHLTNNIPEENWSLEEWIKHDPELFSGFAEPIIEQEPVPVVEISGKQNIKLDQKRLREAVTLEVDSELESFLQNQRESMRKVLDESKKILAQLEAQLERETFVLIDDLPFYHELSPEKFKISTDRLSKTVSICYRVASPVSLFPCLTIECKEKKDRTVACTAKAIELPVAVCSFSSYVGTWIENALNGRTNFNAETWEEAQEKVLSAFKVLDVHFEAFESVRYRLHWCEERRQVYLNMLWRDRVVRAYVDADLREELVPQDATTNLSSRIDDLHDAWKNDGILSFCERINRVHRRNLEIAAEETIQSAKF